MFNKKKKPKLCENKLNTESKIFKEKEIRLNLLKPKMNNQTNKYNQKI